MDVLVSENKKRRSSTFAVTVGGFIIDNYLQQVKTETKVVTTEDQAGQTVKKAAIGAGVGIGKIGGSAMEAMARQPEMHGKIQSSALILAAFVEAVALFGVVVAFLQG